MNNEALERLKNAIEKIYGNVHDERGCYINGVWLSVDRIVRLIDKLDEKY